MPYFKPKVSKRRRARAGSRQAYHAKTPLQDRGGTSTQNRWGPSTPHRDRTPTSRSVVATACRFLLERLRWHNLDWRAKTSVVLGSLFTATVILPSGLAVATHARGEPSVLDWVQTTDAHTPLGVYRLDTGSVTTMALNDYLVDVLAAEVDPQAPMDALQAAAVAARTYAVHAIITPPTPQPTFAQAHGADVTNDALLDLPMLTLADQEQKFKSQQDAVTVRLQQAVISTDGQVLTYQDHAISAFTFQLSPGETRDAKDVFGKDIPYLHSVKCPDDALAAKPVTVHVTSDMLAASLQLAINHPDPKQFRISSTDKHGFVQTVVWQSKSWSGPDFARLLRLPSAHFAMQPEADGLVFNVEGTGSGIGMSLHEAQVMAEGGKRWRDILGFFYPGTKIDKDTSLLQANSAN